ncbi:PREDICTED: ubiquinol oxidase 2, mitochondrial-like [Nicotiana attenuata]|uniref:ubiquinol oxidase 2, mitochondrial-like n=1 Tax=Nicotiana attenuata TaxID=49451 RepID=UPI000905C346|nr:PREDICTED: ubiquinol oxidase 2, mitochondrial-like [Nicotiana attenuata]
MGRLGWDRRYMEFDRIYASAEARWRTAEAVIGTGAMEAPQMRTRRSGEVPPEWRMDQSTVSHERMHLMTFMEVAKPNWYVPAIAIDSYTEFLKELDKGNIENVRAPAIAIDFKA